MEISRRWLLGIVGLLFLFLTFQWRSAMAQFLFRPKRKIRPPRFDNPYKEDGKALVSIVKGNNILEMMREAVSLLGGFEKIGIKGKTVLVKPNVVSGEPHPATTNPEVVRAAVKLLKEHGASRIIVGDMSAMLTLSTKRNMTRTGIKRAAEEEGAEVVYFEDYDWVEVELPGAKYISRVYVTEWIYNVDRVINLPVIKTHRSASYSICLKNFIGATHLKFRPYLIDSAHWEELIAEMNIAYHPHLNIVDGTRIMIEGGPWEGTSSDTNLIIASGDRIAADIAGLKIIKDFGRWKMVVEKDVWEQKQIKRALELGLGAGRGEIKVIEK
ncbi:MAG: DUF362 domain-containing protein [Deltaproteobacteria bacterium]|nr:DUF362 domain-containing protein [Deltaproteobacteria bacterium]